MRLDIARDAMVMHQKGTKLSDVRAAIEKQYGTGATHRTPTELPPS